MESDLAEKLDTFRTSLATAADEIIFKTFPCKILELQALLDTTSSPSSPFHISHAASSTDATVYPAPSNLDEREYDTKKRKRNTASNAIVVDGSVAGNGNSTQYARFPNRFRANGHIHTVNVDIKNLSEELIDLCDKVKLWINLTMPRIEDGDNFGVQIQEEVLTELHRSQESAYNLRDSCRLHHLSRAKICSKIIKYPYLEDYTLALQEHDEKQMYLARMHIYDLRNIYAVITDILHKNIIKLRAPKGNNREGMY